MNKHAFKPTSVDHLESRDVPSSFFGMAAHGGIHATAARFNPGFANRTASPFAFGGNNPNANPFAFGGGPGSGLGAGGGGLGGSFGFGGSGFANNSNGRSFAGVNPFNTFASGNGFSFGNGLNFNNNNGFTSGLFNGNSGSPFVLRGGQPGLSVSPGFGVADNSNAFSNRAFGSGGLFNGSFGGTPFVLR